MLLTSRSRQTSRPQKKMTWSASSSFLFSTFSPFWTFSSSISSTSFAEEMAKYRSRSFFSPFSTSSPDQAILRRKIHHVFIIFFTKLRIEIILLFIFFRLLIFLRFTTSFGRFRPSSTHLNTTSKN
jgi:hypothetical protein